LTNALAFSFSSFSKSSSLILPNLCRIMAFLWLLFSSWLNTSDDPSVPFCSWSISPGDLHTPSLSGLAALLYSCHLGTPFLSLPFVRVPPSGSNVTFLVDSLIWRSIYSGGILGKVLRGPFLETLQVLELLYSTCTFDW
jgi:hypothetical protein